MPDKVEEILKEIHVMFAKCETYHNSPDRVIVSKPEMFELLESLNEAIYEVLDQYEATARSRERARIELDKQAAETVAKAKLDSDDVHAATLLYTDTMLEDIKQVLERTKMNVKREMVEMLAAIEEQEEILDQNKDSVKSGLTELHDNEMYLNALTKLRKKAEDKKLFGDQAELLDKEEDVFEDPKAGAASNLVIRVDKPGDNAGVTFSTKHSHKKKKKAQAPAAAAPQEHEEGTPFTADDFDLDAEYEQWKEEQEGPTEEKPARKGFLGLFGK